MQVFSSCFTEVLLAKEKKIFIPGSNLESHIVMSLYSPLI